MLDWSVIFDAHLDLAYSAVQGRDLTRPLPQPLHDETAMVNFAALREAGVRACLGTLWAYPSSKDHPEGYTTAQEARKQALLQLEHYLRWQDQGHIRLLASGQELLEHWNNPQDAPLGVVLLMEGADPISGPEDLHFWHREGLRVVGLAWERTRYSGGTNAPGGLTAEGRELVHAIKELNLTLDASHLAEQAFWELVEIHQKVIASHSNAQALVPTDRQLSDAMLQKIGDLNGRIGLVLFNTFIKAGVKKGMPKNAVGFSDLLQHAQHMAGLIGWDKVGLGSDLDGGFGWERTPAELQRVADLHRFFELLPEQARAGVEHQNWLDWLVRNL
ncbi:dipeptidase [Deinococcus roseus]|uniref:Peptidase n=1 Tax=Deinococcus roseus TaxID=392414 RepID=A0ABQ2CYA4_9DEIO|nr:membrane dipeptidase [Deinococcus roseus]GGJ32847.1 peptidase [Deinococcus roseus]